MIKSNNQIDRLFSFTRHFDTRINILRNVRRTLIYDGYEIILLKIRLIKTTM